MNILQDDVNRLLESRQKALDHCTSYHNKRNKLDSDLQSVDTRLNEAKNDAQKPLAQKVKTLKVSRLFAESASCWTVAECTYLTASQKITSLCNRFDCSPLLIAHTCLRSEPFRYCRSIRQQF